jgi:hypothetical protein
MSMSDEEWMRITLRPKDLLERHKILVAMSMLESMCFGVAIAALIVAAVTWAMSL